MNNIMKIFSSIVLALVIASGVAFAQTAAILPNAVSQYFDNNGNPLSAGTVTTYVVGTSTLKTTWRNAAETIPNTNPVILDAGGKAIIYGDGNYRQVLRDRNGNLIWDAVTSAFGSGGATLLGDGNSVGTILNWSGIVAPTHYVFTYGQELSRVTYISLYGIVTLNANANCTIASNILTGLSDTTQIPIGAPVEASCIAGGTTVTAKTGSTVTVSNNASVTVSTTARFFPWGNGNGTTTFNVPDLRGKVLPGRDNMGGTAAANLTITYYGVNPDALGASGGAQSKTLATANLPAYTPAGTIVSTQGSHNHFISNADGGNTTSATLTNSTSLEVTNINAASSTNYVLAGSGTTPTLGLTSSATPTITSTFTGTAQGGVATAFSLIQPSITMNYIIKVLPDTSISTLNVVTTLGGMSGDITCSAPIVCAAQNIGAGGTGSGDVIGPSSSLDGSIVLFNGGTGKVIKDSVGVIPNATTFSSGVTLSSSLVGTGTPASGTAVPNNPFGGSWSSLNNLGLTDNTSHAAGAVIAFSVSSSAVGSTVDTPAASNYSGFFVSTKQSYLTSIIHGEIDGIYSVVTQGKFGDAGGFLADVTKVNGGTGSSLSAEMASTIVNSSGVVQQLNKQHLGWNDIGTSEYLGFNAEAQTGTLTSAFQADTFNASGVPAWTNVLTARTTRNNANIYYQITGAGKTLASGGTAAAPSYAFVGAATDGMWHPGAGALGWATSGVNRMSLDTTKLYPNIDNTYALGDLSFKWSTVIATRVNASYWDATNVVAPSTPGAGATTVFVDSTAKRLHDINDAGIIGTTVVAVTCSNQFLTVISTAGVGTCTTDTLASAQHANQGTTTTVLHGNAAGNPSWAAVTLTTDITGVLPVANGGTNCSVASITCFNNITGYTASGATGTTSTNLVFSASPTLTANVVITGGTLTDGAQALNITATQPTTPTGDQNAFTLTVVSAGTASQINRAGLITYSAGYTGSSATTGLAVNNGAAGTGTTLIPASGSLAIVANMGLNNSAVVTTTGTNIGTTGRASGGDTNVGIVGIAQVAKTGAGNKINIGGAFSAFNTVTGGSTAIQIGLWASLNQTTTPTTSAAFIADNGAQSASIALFQAAGVTVASFGSTGILTTPSANLSGTSNQLVFQSTGVTGTISWAPATSNKTITLPNGTTDFTATGGTSQVVKQTSAGAAFTVARLACADLSDAAATCSSATGETLVIGTTAITSGTTTRILYDNAGVLGEYTITGTGTVVTMQTSPTITTAVLNGTITGTSQATANTVSTLVMRDASGNFSAGTITANINGTVGATTPTTGAFTTVAASTSVTVTSASAVALTVGLNGATNPAFAIDASTASQAAGFKITGAATGGTVALVAIDSGSNTNLTLNAKGSGTIGIGSVSTGAVTITPALTLSAALTYGGVILSNSVTGTGSMVLSASPTFTGTLTNSGIATNGTDTVTSASATALTVGRLGATTPALQIDASTATSITGIKIKSAATGGGVAISAIGETNVNMTIDANGSGTLILQGTATGAITLTRATTLSAALTYGGVALSNAVTGTGNMVLSASPTFTGTLTAATITPTTINAFTLGGTIAGGGNQINNIIIGTTTPLAGSFTTTTISPTAVTPITVGGDIASFQLLGTTAASGAALFFKGVAAAGGPNNRMTKSRNTTIGSFTIVNVSDQLGTFQFWGDDGTQYVIGAQIGAVVDAAPGVNDMPTRLTFATTLDGASTVTTRQSIFNDGGVNFGATTTSPGAGVVKVEATTDATASGTGAFQVAGGMSVIKRVFMIGLSASAGINNGYVCQLAGGGGEIVAESALANCVVSARRFKDVQGILPKTASNLSAFDVVMKMNPVLARMKAVENQPPSEWKPMFIADEAELLDKRLVSYGKDGLVRSFHYDFYTVTLTQAFQQRVNEENQRYSELKADNDNLRERLERLEARMK